jgi:acyl-CoA synthetase (AMP-forming)/AMP-acid ligase II
MTEVDRVTGEVVDYEALRTLGDIARYHARQRPKSIALSFEGRQTDFDTFDRHTEQVANQLLAGGLASGQRIAYIGKNSDHFFELLFGAAKVGIVLTPIGWRLTAAEMAYILRDSAAVLIFVGAEVAGAVENAVRSLPQPLPMIAMEPTGTALELFETWRARGASTPIAFAADEEQVVLQLYTAGTTGRPKGALLAHRSILSVRRRAAKAGMNWNVWAPEDISLAAMPVGHVGGSVWGVVGLFHGAKTVVAREFDPLKVLDFIERDRISKIFMVPAALRIVLNQPRVREVDFSRLRYVVYGSSPMPVDLLRQCLEVFRCGFCQTYGMTETSGTIVYLPPEDHDPAGNQRMRAAGIPFPGVEIKVVDRQGNVLPAHNIGEILTRSEANMIGYWRQPEASAQILDADGWLHTGDAGYLDEDGYLYISDRLKDVIISGAENIYPAEIEDAVHAHPAVADVAVIGVPDEKWGEAVKAIVVLHPGASLDAESLIAFTRTRIAAFKAPKSVDFTQTLPRNAAGKILRRELREPYWRGYERRVN